MDTLTPRLILHPISPDEASRILDGKGRTDGAWHAQYPFEDELVPLGSLAVQVFAEPVFSLYQVRERQSGLAVGGIGFFGPPSGAGEVELGYGFVLDARGRGYATESVEGMLAIARDHGARVAMADTELGNRASQRVLEKCGFAETHRSGGVAYFRRELVHAS